MQDVQPINGGVVSGRVILKTLTHHHQQQQQQSPPNFNLHHHQPPLQPPPQALKCPRCDSLNTKFCYYNNYNLSQPRHFCKNCRRYWTKGGVLRNVPVGGGCRKSKRSSSSSSSNHKHKSSSNCNNKKSSSSDSSSTPPAVTGSGLFHIPEMSSELDPLVDSSSTNYFMSLITHTNSYENNDIFGNANEDANGVSATSFSEFMQNQEWDMGKICGVHHDEQQKIDLVVDQTTIRIEDFLQNRGSNVGLSTLDWHLTAGNNQGFFDVPDHDTTTTVDHQDYWNQSTTAVHHNDHDSQWSDSNTATTHLPLFLP